MSEPNPVVEYFYAAYSGFAYLGSAKFMGVASAAGRKIIHRPIDLRVVVKATSAAPFAKRSQQHIRYYFGREITRWAEHRNVAIMDGIPTHHNNDITLPNCTLIACIEQGHNADNLAHAMLEAHWRDNADLADRDTLAALAQMVGLDPEPLLDAALTPEVMTIYEANTKEAIERSVFGSPTYFVDGDMFYGQDRLELVERAMQKAYAGKWV